MVSLKENATGFVRRLRARIAEFHLGRRLDRLQRRAAEASAAFRPQYHLRAAQAARVLNRDADALRLYGEAIDGYLEAGRSRAAEVVCRKVLAEYPGVVRARRTLALLALGREDVGEAVALLRDYAFRSRTASDPYLLVKSLRMFALISDSEPFRAQALAELEALGDDEGTRRILEGSEEPTEFAGMGRWSQAVQAALLGPEALRELPI